MKRLSGYLKIIVALTLLSNSGLLVQAQFIQTTLLGGDPADGITLNPSLALGAVYADNSSTGLAYSLQGVTFNPYNTPGSTVSGINLSLASTLPINIAATAANQSFTAPGNSADDKALLNIVNGGLMYDGVITGFTATFSGLTAGQSYKLNFISSLTQYPGRDGTLSINGSAPQTFTYEDSPIYLFSGTAIAQPDGTITAFFGEAGNSAPFTNALEIESTVAVPEPSSYVLIILGGVMTLVLQWRHSKMA